MTRIGLANELLPWRPVPVILRAESDKDLTGRVILGLALLVVLLVFSLAMLNVLSMQRKN